MTRCEEPHYYESSQPDEIGEQIHLSYKIFGHLPLAICPGFLNVEPKVFSFSGSRLLMGQATPCHLVV